MAGSSFGTIFTVTSWGESHGKAIGVVIDGCPAGLALSEEILQPYLDRRKPGTSAFTTKRKESDTVEILSGVFEGKTTGTPISLLVRNEDQRSKDYSEIASYYRPGHADYTYDQKYGFRDYRGGGRSSARETIARVAAGAVACEALKELGVSVQAYVKQIGPVVVPEGADDWAFAKSSPLCMPDQKSAEDAEAYLHQVIAEEDSVGGVVECVITGVKPGVGAPTFAKLDAELAKAVMSINAVKAVEIGDGVRVAEAKGSENNDAFVAEGKTRKATNHAGGILGGISDGDPIVVRATFKPTPSIAKEQQTINRDGEEISVQVKGRHDPIVVTRAVVVVEAMAAITLVDQMLMGMGAKLENVKKIWGAPEA
ncbi:MAG: chorismate synthase [Lachnospiraceae bacterium]|nr:chorismate synthase [Lachnospiraceae bacterium]